MFHILNTIDKSKLVPLTDGCKTVSILMFITKKDNVIRTFQIIKKFHTMYPGSRIKIYFKPLYCNERPIRRLKMKIEEFGRGVDYDILTSIEECTIILNRFENSFSVDLDKKATVVKFGDYFFNGMNDILLVFGDEKLGIDPEINSLTKNFIMLDTHRSINLVCATTVFLYEFLIS